MARKKSRGRKSKGRRSKGRRSKGRRKSSGWTKEKRRRAAKKGWRTRRSRGR